MNETDGIINILRLFRPFRRVREMKFVRGRANRIIFHQEDQFLEKGCTEMLNPGEMIQVIEEWCQQVGGISGEGKEIKLSFAESEESAGQSGQRISQMAHREVVHE
ncbi:MAG: hypothetical protein IPJ07_05545 [Acidobacteria bacterium]|nr:hypothetical protein [Acidobacteriota bacterium]